MEVEAELLQQSRGASEQNSSFLKPKEQSCARNKANASRWLRA